MPWKDFVEQKPPHFGYERGCMYLLEVKCAGMPDKIKDIFCKENNIPLLRINYWLFREPYSYKNILQKFFASTTLQRIG